MRRHTLRSRTMQGVKNTIKFKTQKLLKRIDLSQEAMAASGLSGLGDGNLQLIEAVQSHGDRRKPRQPVANHPRRGGHERKNREPCAAPRIYGFCSHAALKSAIACSRLAA
jgi:hypothetical protein